MLALRHQDKACQARLAALEALEQEQASAWGILQTLVVPQFGIARVYAAIVSYHWDSVVPELKAIDPMVKKMRRVREALQAQLLSALAGQQAGDECKEMIGEAVSLATTLGLGRVVADTYPGFADSATFEVKVSQRRERQTGQGAAAGNDERLAAPKETEVLQLLAGNLSNKKIALALGVGDQTIKWHLKNMFHKLQAGTRQHLLARARMLGILE